MKGIGFSKAGFRGCAVTCLFNLLAGGFCAAASTDQQRLVHANDTFAFNLLTQLAKDQPGSNIFVSPYGASAALQMICTWAKGPTKTEMERVLGIAGLPPAALNKANKALTASLNTQTTNVTLTAANSIWYQKGITVNPGFIAANRQFFGATVEALDFSGNQAVEAINGWAAAKTHGFISRILQGPVDGNTKLFLANAVYFHGKWEMPFDVASTTGRVFHRRDGRPSTLPMMQQHGDFAYHRGPGYQAVRLGYLDTHLCMYLLLPEAGSGPQKLLGNLNADTWRAATEKGFAMAPGTLVLPRFKLEYGVELTRPLKSLGLKGAFTEPDFSGISDRSLSISALRQQTYVEVDEEGTKSEAVTLLEIAEGIEDHPFEMIVDRPFLFLIEDRQTGTILFLGMVFEP